MKAPAPKTWFCFSGDFLFLGLTKVPFGKYVFFFFSRLLKQIQVKGGLVWEGRSCCFWWVWRLTSSVVKPFYLLFWGLVFP